MHAKGSPEHQEHVRAVRITDGAVIVDQVMDVYGDVLIVGTKLVVANTVDATGVDFTVLNLAAAAYKSTAAICSSTMLELKMWDECSVDTKTDFSTPTSLSVAADLAVFSKP
ncbi:hypothetical protein DFJ73DRAFT_796808 [Zopfochytrium polystomum]|nr:hypothetical protein DFJ73DRAFT_796808 [Zopfochytrium polystomum]